MDWMAKMLQEDPSLQEFIEKALGYLFNLAEEEEVLEDLENEMDIDRSTIESYFLKLGYDRHEGYCEEVE